jgi:hypothetical protein
LNSNITESKIFLCEVFGVPLKDTRNVKYFHTRRKVTSYNLWKRITEEQFNVLCNIVKDEFELGDIKYQVFFKVIDEYRSKVNTDISNEQKRERYWRNQNGRNH